MSETVHVAVPRKGRPLEAVLDRLAGHPDAPDDAAAVADDVSNVLRYEKAVTKDEQDAAAGVYDRLADYSTPGDDRAPDFTLLRDDRAGFPRRVVFDSVTIGLGNVDVHLVGREEPFRALRTHEFALGFDSADLVLEEVVGLEPDPLTSLADVNDRIDPHDTDVRVVTGLGDTVYHTLLATHETVDAGPTDTLGREFVADYEGSFCISPRYERLVEAVLGTRATDGLDFVYPESGVEEEAAIADAGVGAYLTVTGSTAREHGLELGERLFPSETVLMENACEADSAAIERVRDALGDAVEETAIAMN
ncbi:hypothetical protein [Salarchaeum sp. JOR-1]|uniref:hypothetical protein n=1 Tax=Salarchaeum sp. JOR-1 TaxID=2599399 RepID=UPI00119847B1|nr:hypothetical protein [Salarchaeum sp. JOR-1]QDX41214.1 hypothetical protein FQU85_10020 [Salarchaeum sp. JOR-1]